LVCTPIISTTGLVVMLGAFITTGLPLVAAIAGTVVFLMAWAADYWDGYLAIIFSILAMCVAFIPLGGRS